MPKRLLPIWQKFEAQSLVGAPTEQRVEMQKAFYMGASALISLMLEIPEESSEEEGAEVLDQLYKECDDFLKQAAADYERRHRRGFGRGGGS
jgi:hypothetical protein